MPWHAFDDPAGKRRRGHSDSANRSLKVEVRTRRSLENEKREREAREWGHGNFWSGPKLRIFVPIGTKIRTGGFATKQRRFVAFHVGDDPGAGGGAGAAPKRAWNCRRSAWKTSADA